MRDVSNAETAAMTFESHRFTAGNAEREIEGKLILGDEVVPQSPRGWQADDEKRCVGKRSYHAGCWRE